MVGNEGPSRMDCMAKWYFCASSQCRRKKQNGQDDQAKPINISHWQPTNDETHTHTFKNCKKKAPKKFKK